MIHIVIVGAGFSGLKAINYLLKQQMKQSISITVINPDTNQFYPLLPEIISGQIDWHAASFTFQQSMTKKNISVINGTAISIDETQKTITLHDHSTISYDYLLLCNGSQPAVYMENTKTVSSIEDATDIRDQVIKLIKTCQEITISIIGAGLTGIETVTAIKHLCKKFHYKRVTLYLLERSDQLLKHLPEFVINGIEKELISNDIQLITNAHYSIKGNHLLVNQHTIICNLIIICTGVKGSAQQLLPEYADKHNGKIMTKRTLQVSNEIFAAGDASICLDKSHRPVRPSAENAIYGGLHAARNIIRMIRKQPLKEYKPVDSGYIIPLFTGRGYGQLFNIPIRGKMGLFLHKIICIYRSNSLQNRLQLVKNYFIHPYYKTIKRNSGI